MSDRIIRDDILDSDRYLSLSSDSARLLFVHLVLVADDLGNAEAGSFFIRRRLMCGRIEDAAINRILEELADQDLIRLYVNDDKRYAHIPRFRQRLRFITGKNPRPPATIECQEIKDLLVRKSVFGQASVGPKTAEVKRSEEKRSEEKLKRTKPLASSPPVLSAPASPVAIEIPLNDNTGYAVTESLVGEWKELYPQVDVDQTLREIRGWNLANPTRRKTRTGVLKHVNAWLAKEQNSG